MRETATRLLETTLDASVVSQTRLSGGDFADSSKVTLSDGRVVFLKTHSDPPAHFFSTEATGLSWLRATGSLSIPEVLLVSDDTPCLGLEWIDEGARVASGEETLGRQLAALHQSPFECFGRPDHRTTGSLAVPNDPCSEWVDFYRDMRLIPLTKLAGARQALAASTQDKLYRLSESLDQHDLWAGNRIVDRGGVSWLIDPAAHGNHREFDLAMMRLFGGYGDACFAAYQEAQPLAIGWQDRIPLMQLAPLIVHAIKFGGHYAAATDDAVSRYVD